MRRPWSHSFGIAVPNLPHLSQRTGFLRGGGSVLLVSLALGLSGAQHVEAQAGPFPLGRAASSPAELAIAFEEAAVVAAGLTPGGEALLFSVAREPQDYFTRVVRRDEPLLVDAEGQVQYEPFEGASPLPRFAIWVVVDLETGRLVHASTPGFEAPARALPADGVRRGSGGRWNRLAARLTEAQILLVRPAAYDRPGGTLLGPPGAWGGYWMDGSGRDVDGSDDGGLEAVLEDFVPVTASGTPPPEELAPDDLLVLVDPSNLAYFVVRITPGVLNRSGS